MNSRIEQYAKKKNHIVILTDIVIVIWVTILVVIFEFHFHWKKYKNYDDVIFAGVSAKQACSLTSGEYDLSAGASL